MGTTYMESERGLPEACPLQEPKYGVLSPMNANFSSDHNNHVTTFSNAELHDERPKVKTTRAEWRRVWFDFSQGTTLHGINKITEENPFTIRR